MQRRGTTFDSPTLVPLVLILSLFLIAMMSYSATRPERAQADYTIDAVYLVLSPQPTLDATRLRTAGVRLVASASELQATPAQAIIIDRDALDSVDAVWLASQYRQGKLIVGIDIPILELAQRADYANTQSGIGNYPQDYKGQSFYSLFYDMTEQSGVTRGGTGSDIIYSTDDFNGRLRIEAQNSQAKLNPPQSPRPTPPRR